MLNESSRDHESPIERGEIALTYSERPKMKIDAKTAVEVVAEIISNKSALATDRKKRSNDHLSLIKSAMSGDNGGDGKLVRVHFA